jgi:hypothetical protein
VNDAADREECETDRAAQEALARDILARDRRHVWHPFTQHGTEAEPLLIAAARGASLYDVALDSSGALFSNFLTLTIAELV